MSARAHTRASLPLRIHPCAFSMRYPLSLRPFRTCRAHLNRQGPTPLRRRRPSAPGTYLTFCTGVALPPFPSKAWLVAVLLPWQMHPRSLSTSPTASSTKGGQVSPVTDVSPPVSTPGDATDAPGAGKEEGEAATTGTGLGMPESSVKALPSKAQVQPAHVDDALPQTGLATWCLLFIDLIPMHALAACAS